MVVFSISFIAGLILVQFGHELTPMAIEFGGAMVGLFAAIALGEVLKSVSRWRSARDLHESITDELLEIHQEIESAEANAVPVPVWDASISNGRVLDLKYKERTEFNKVFREIKLFNRHETNEFRERAKKAIEDYFPPQDEKGLLDVLRDWLNCN
jgi:hypothetical protein